MSAIDAKMLDWRETFMLQSENTRLKKVEDCLQEAKKFLREEDSLLDVGCGRGYTYELLGHKKYFGVDLNEDEVGRARSSFPLAKFEVANLFDLTEQHDVVLCSRVLIHIAPLEGAIRKLQSLSKRLLLLIMKVGPDDLREVTYGGQKTYMRSVCESTLHEFGKCKVVHGKQYSLVVYER